MFGFTRTPSLLPADKYANHRHSSLRGSEARQSHKIWRGCVANHIAGWDGEIWSQGSSSSSRSKAKAIDEKTLGDEVWAKNSQPITQTNWSGQTNSFQLAKTRARMKSSLPRVMPLHSDGRGKKRGGNGGEWGEFIPALGGGWVDGSRTELAPALSLIWTASVYTAGTSQSVFHGPCTIPALLCDSVSLHQSLSLLLLLVSVVTFKYRHEPSQLPQP